MAQKKSKKDNEGKIERIYTIRLRKESRKVPRYKRAKKAISAVRQFLIRHMKVQEVKILKELNQKILERGRKNPPHKVHVKAIKQEERGVFLSIEHHTNRK